MCTYVCIYDVYNEFTSGCVVYGCAVAPRLHAVLYVVCLSFVINTGD